MAGQVRIYIASGTALLAILALADVISIATAMFSSFCGGTVLLALIWTLIQHRRALLLNIDEPKLRDQAHRAMLAYLRQVRHGKTIFIPDNDPPGDYSKDCPNCNLP